MQVRYDAARCCCARPAPDDKCPCFEDTLATTGKLIRASGFAIDPIIPTGFPDIVNGNVIVDLLQALGLFNNIDSECGFGRHTSTTGTTQTSLFTTVHTMSVTALDSIDVFSAGVKTNFLLSAGVKSVIAVSGEFRAGSSQLARTVSVFEKVLVDVNGFVDCGFPGGVTGYSFVGQDSQFTYHAFNASGATVSYT